MRINLLIARSGLCSRREADAWISAGRVTVNGRPAIPGDRADRPEDVRVDGRPLPASAPPLVLALNKPVGIICTTDRRVNDNVIDYLAWPERIFPIGRLDRDSHGLLLLTNDGSLVNPILRASSAHEKEYRVRVDRPYPDPFLRTMASGVRILDRMTLPCRTVRTGPDTFRIILHQGLNRQIRRMCEQLGYGVLDLERVRIMNISLGSLRPGQTRPLTYKEVRDLRALLDRAPSGSDEPGEDED
ncbi:MAG: pseudouridine synthase [Clostridia bacterium]|nr:pseudouridine synthase [Clostridia bacterium]